jgi:iron complex outermembrane receptor protein
MGMTQAKRGFYRSTCLAGCTAALAWAAPAQGQQLAGAFPYLKRLSIEELSNLEVSSVSRTPEPVSGAPASVYVITGEDVRRSGSTTLAEILRLAPNLHVARIASGDYAVAARGFNSSVSNKLLVMIDGRTIYTPLYSGVFWDMQSLPPADIERIEVVSGPGGTLWGSNAVNGVINVVSRSSADNEGALVRISGGNADVSGAAQYSGKISDSGSYRIYGQGLRQGHTLTAAGLSGQDSWELFQGGFRTDWALAAGALTVQGDIYDGLNSGGIDLKGHNLLARWQQTLDADSDIEVQAYYDSAARSIRGGIRDSIDTFDVAAQHRLDTSARNRIVWGGGYRVTTDELTPGPKTSFLIPSERTLQLWNIFINDTFAITPSLKLSVGLKVEHNTYTGLEYMPDARLSWQVTPQTMLWAGVSRAARTPSRFDRDLNNTGILAGGPNFQSETLIAYEAGYRAQLMANATFSLSLFYNDYDRLRTVEPPFPLTIQNRMEGETYGAEAWATLEPLNWWRLKASAMVLHKNLRLEPGSNTFFGIQQEGNDPKHQFSLRSEMNLTNEIELDVGLRAVGALPNPRVPAYVSADARIGWNVNDNVQLSLSGFNLLNAAHPEFVVPSPTRRDIRRSVYATARWSF